MAPFEGELFPGMVLWMKDGMIAVEWGDTSATDVRMEEVQPRAGVRMEARGWHRSYVGSAMTHHAVSVMTPRGQARTSAVMSGTKESPPQKQQKLHAGMSKELLGEAGAEAEELLGVATSKEEHVEAVERARDVAVTAEVVEVARTQQARSPGTLVAPRGGSAETAELGEAGELRMIANERGRVVLSGGLHSESARRERFASSPAGQAVRGAQHYDVMKRTVLAKRLDQLGAEELDWMAAAFPESHKVLEVWPSPVAVVDDMQAVRPSPPLLLCPPLSIAVSPLVARGIIFGAAAQ